MNDPGMTSPVPEEDEEHYRKAYQVPLVCQVEYPGADPGASSLRTKRSAAELVPRGMPRRKDLQVIRLSLYPSASLIAGYLLG